MLAGLSDMWRLWRNRRRKTLAGSHRRTWSSPALDQWRDTAATDPRQPGVGADHDAVDLWIFHDQLDAMEKNISRLLQRLSREPEDVPSCADDECIVCTTSRACMQTFPCGHRVLCRKCFIRTIQVAVSERHLPLRCVVCRTKIARLKRHAVSRVRVRVQQTPPAPNQNGFYPTSSASVSCSPVISSGSRQRSRRLSPPPPPLSFDGGGGYCAALLKKLSGASTSSGATSTASSSDVKPRPIVPNSLHRHLC